MFELVALISPTTPPSAFEKLIPDTPLRSSSASQGRLEHAGRALMQDVKRTGAWPTRLSKSESLYSRLFREWCYALSFSADSVPQPTMPVDATHRSLGGLSGDPLGVVKKEITHFEECLGEHLHRWPFCVTTRGHI